MKPVKKKFKLPAKIKEDTQKLMGPLLDAGYECYLVGGSVRDLVMNKAHFDYDFATNAHPDAVMRLFRRTVPTGIKHGTVTVLIGDGKYEVTTYRADGKYIDGRRPQSVTFSKTLEEDIARRDFTINGLAYDAKNEEIIDYVDGLGDIDRRIIKTIGSPIDRFSEDGLRAFRACRFAAKLYFEIESETFGAITQTLGIAKLVSVERVREELMKLIEAEKPSIGLEYMRRSGLLNLFLPELARCHGVEQNKYHVYDIYYHSVYSCDSIPDAVPIIKLAALLHDIAKFDTKRMGDEGDYTFYNHEVIGAKIAGKIMRRLKFSNEEVSRAVNLVQNHMFHYIDEWTDGAVRRFMRKVGLENLDDLFTLRLADRRGNGQRDGLPAPIGVLMKRIEKIIEDENAITVRDLDINGHIIMEEFKLEPGPIIGKILNELLEMVLDAPEMNTRETLLSKAREIYENIEK